MTLDFISQGSSYIYIFLKLNVDKKQYINLVYYQTV